MKNKILLIVLAASLIAGVTVYFSRDYFSGVTFQQQSADKAVTETEPAPDGSPGSESPAGTIPNPGIKTRSRHEAYTELAEKLTAPENTLKRDVFIDKASGRLQTVKSELTLAIGGDDEASDKVLKRARECRQFNPMTMLDIETEIAYYRDSFNRRRGDGEQNPERMEERLAKSRSAMQARVENCSWRHTEDFPGLRAQVETQAEAGDVLARFYYAMLLKPSPYENNYLLETAAWSDNSLRFTMANINQNMTMGYLALAFSHAQGIFTHQDARLAGIWAYVLMSCPISGPIANPYLNTLLSMERMEYLSGTTVDIGQVWARQVCQST
jgi:hypothetical protein